MNTKLWVGYLGPGPGASFRELCDLGQVTKPVLTSTCASLMAWAYHLMVQMVESLPAMQETWVQFPGWEDPLEKEMATHSSILAWRIPWTEEPGGLQSMGSQRVGHDWVRLNPHILVKQDIQDPPFFFFFWLCWVFVAAFWLSLVVGSKGYPLVAVCRFCHCGGFYCCRAGSRVPGLQCCCVWAQFQDPFCYNGPYNGEPWANQQPNVLIWG